MKKKIDEEKEKAQNLQFTNEEQNVVNIELQNKNSELLIKIKELQFNLDNERNLAKDIEKEKMKIFEKEEELCRVKEELESLKKVIDNNEDELQKSVSNLSSEVVDKEVLLNTLRQTLNENSQTHDRLLKEANDKLTTTTEQLNKIIEEKNKKIEQSQEMIDQLNEGIKCLSALKNEEHDDIVNNLKNDILKLKEEHKMTIEKKDYDIQTSLKKGFKVENELKQELTNLMKNKNHEIEEIQKKYNNLMCMHSTEKEYVKNLKLELQKSTENLNKFKDLEVALKSQIQSTLVKFEDLKNQFEESNSREDKRIETCDKTLIYIKEQLINSKSDLQISFNDKVKEKDDEIKILSEKLNIVSNDLEQLEIVNKNLSLEAKSVLKSVEDKTNKIAELEKKYNDLESQQDLNRNELEKELTAKLKCVNDELDCLKLEKSALEEKHKSYLQEVANTIKDMDSKLLEKDGLVENLNKSLIELTVSKDNELEVINKQVKQLEEDKEQILRLGNLELASKDEKISALSNKLELILSEKQKQDLNNDNLQTEFTTQITKHQTSIKELQNEIDELKVQIATNNEKFKKEFDLLNNEKETTKSENLDLLEKLRSLESLKLNLESKLNTSELCKQDIQELNKTIKEKIDIIDDNQIKIKQLDNSIVQIKNNYEIKLKKKEEEIQELLKAEEENRKKEKLSLEEKTKVILNEKDEENLILKNQIKEFENIKSNLEKQLMMSKSQEEAIKELNETVKEKNKIIEDSNIKIEQLNNLTLHIKSEFETKLQEKEIEVKEISKTCEEKLEVEKNLIKDQSKAILIEKEKENTDLLEKLSILENTKASLEEQLKINQTLEVNSMEFKKEIEEKSKIINDNNLNIEQLNSIIVLSKEEFNVKLKEKEDEIKQLMKIGDEKLINEKSEMENHMKSLLDEKNKENTNLIERLNKFEKTKLNLEKQLETSKIQEEDLLKLKKVIDEKTNIIDDNLLKIEQLNSLITQTKEDFDLKLKEKEKEINNLVKAEEEKLSVINIEFEKHTKTCLDEKDKEIEMLKTKLQEFVENNPEKELMLKLESIGNELEMERKRTLNLEVLKGELEEKTLKHKTELELLEVSKNNLKADMAKTIEEQKDLNEKLTAKIEIESKQLNDEKLQIEKQILELNTECSTLKFELDERNREIEYLKKPSPKTTDSDNNELNRLKDLL